MTIHIYQSAHRYTAFALTPYPCIGYSAETPVDALIKFAKHQCALPTYITSFEELSNHFSSFEHSKPTIHSTFPNISFTSIRNDYPEFFV